MFDRLNHLWNRELSLPLQQPSNTRLRGFLFGRANLIILTMLALCMLSFPGTSFAHGKGGHSHPSHAQGKGEGPGTTSYRGLITQVDASNSQDVIFSILDRTGSIDAFNVTPATRFNKHSSASQLAINVVAEVKARANNSGGLDALQVVLQQNASFNLPGILQNYDSASGQLTLTTSGNISIVFATTNATTVEGAASLADIAIGTPISVGMLVQSDGSYLATKVEVESDSGTDS
jgi:hypothetical protein